MKKIKILIISFLIVNFSILTNAKEVPKSFADLAEKLIPSVVNISTTQTVVTNTNPFPFEFLVLRFHHRAKIFLIEIFFYVCILTQAQISY